MAGRISFILDGRVQEIDGVDPNTTVLEWLRGPAGRPLGALPVLVVGLFLLYIGAALPFVGFAVWLATVLYGMGALVLALLGGQKGLPLVMLAPDRPPPPAPPPLAGFGP